MRAKPTWLPQCRKWLSPQGITSPLTTACVYAGDNTLLSTRNALILRPDIKRSRCCAGPTRLWVATFPRQGGRSCFGLPHQGGRSCTGLPPSRGKGPIYAPPAGGAGQVLANLGAQVATPLDDLRTGGGPHAVVLYDVIERSIEAADAERLADQKGVQVQDQEPPVVRTVVV